MNKLLNKFTQLFTPDQLVPAGLYHYQTPPAVDPQYRLHLRVNRDGEGLFIINASTILHLNQTATEYAYFLIKDMPLEEVANQITKRYQVDRKSVRADYLDLKDKITTLIEIPDLDPISFLDISRKDPYSGAESAPYRLDCALTYKLPETDSPELAPVRRVDRELSSKEWKNIIDQSWRYGIPHLIFTGGEPTLREDLNDLIAHAEKNGQITGLITDGYKLIDDSFRTELLQSGLDHLLFLLTPSNQKSWDALRAILNEDLHTTVHITIGPDILTDLPKIIGSLKEFGANAVSLSISSPDASDLIQALAETQTLVAESGIPLKWDLPVPYSAHNPISIEMESDQAQPEGAGKAWFYVEPDGDLLPAQGINQVLGNILNADWDHLLLLKQEKDK